MDHLVQQFPRSRNPVFAGEMKPVAMALGLAFGLGAAPAASAATITVNNLSGISIAGQCTLRDALQAADTNAAVQGCAAGSGADTINFSVTGTISLATELTINSDVTINGPGAASLTLAPSSTNRALYIKSNHTTAISGVTFQGNGTTLVDGAALYHYSGTLTIQNCVFTGNKTTTKGGAIFNYGGTLIIKSSTFTGNRAGDRGGAIFMYSGNLSIDASTLSGNQSVRDGGAISFYHYGGTNGALTMTNSTLSGNQSTGATSRGGAVHMYRTLASTITNSTISGNSSNNGSGALYLRNSSPLTISNSTVSGNSAVNIAGGITLYKATLNLVSTIVANSSSGTGTRDIEIGPGGIVNGTNSLVQNATGFGFSSGSGNITGVNPLLGPLANNGGPTQTMALLAGSPAIDKGSNPLALAFDQRGTPFVRSSGVTDIGAYEVQGAPPPPPVASVPVPTLSQWSLALLSAMMAGWAMLTGFGKRRRR